MINLESLVKFYSQRTIHRQAWWHTFHNIKFYHTSRYGRWPFYESSV